MMLFKKSAVKTFFVMFRLLFEFTAFPLKVFIYEQIEIKTGGQIINVFYAC